MEIIALDVEKKIIGVDVYQNIAVKSTKCMLESYGYECKETLGKGTFGEVIKVVNKAKSIEVAAKIVLNTDTKKSEIEIWKKLSHDNILPLLGQVKFMDAPTTVFFSPICEGSLNNMLEGDNFMKKRKVFKVLLKYLHGIVNGLDYLHGENLNHLDVKISNVLIKKDGNACLWDFGCICEADRLVDSYASPFYCRPPEAQLTRDGQTPVIGIKYDVWTLGVLALEMFTRKMLSETILKTTGGRICSWTEQVYPIMSQILKEENFGFLIQRSSPVCEVSRKSAKNMKNFLVSCLILDPEARASCSNLKVHKLFKGSYKYINPNPSDEIWNKYATPKKLEHMINKYKQKMEIESPKVQVDVIDLSKGDNPNIDKENVPSNDANIENEVTNDETTVVFEKVKKKNPNARQKRTLRTWLIEKCGSIRKLFSSCMPVKQSY